MSTSAPTPLPPSSGAVSAQAAAQADATADTQALATDSISAPIATQVAPATGQLIKHLSHLLSSPINSAALFCIVTYGTVHFMGSKLPTPKLKLAAAAAFGAILYGTAALRDKDPAVGLKGLRIIANDATASSNLSLAKRLAMSWYITFPAIAIAAASLKQLTPITMAVAAGALMLLPMILRTQGILA